MLRNKGYILNHIIPSFFNVTHDIDQKADGLGGARVSQRTDPP
jgi:hypothetical protein